MKIEEYRVEIAAFDAQDLPEESEVQRAVTESLKDLMANGNSNACVRVEKGKTVEVAPAPAPFELPGVPSL